MFIELLLHITIFGVVFGNYDEYYHGSPEYWSHGVADHSPGDDWWYDIGGYGSQASEYLAATSPFYQWFKKAQIQYDMFAPAKHVGKINRGIFQNPEINLPADRAFGHKSDFHDHDLISGAFEYRPRGQKIVARKVDVLAGIANHVGEIIRLSLPVYVKKDGTLLVKVGRGNRAHPSDPCSRQPDPCSDFPSRSRCVPIHDKYDDTVKCLGPVTTKIELRWKDPDEGDEEENEIFLGILPRNHDGSSCIERAKGSSGPPTEVLGPLGDFIPFCGVTLSRVDEADSKKFFKETAVLGTLPDDIDEFAGTTPKDYSYAVFAFNKNSDDYNFNQGSLKLTVYDDTYGSMQAIQHITVPQGDTINKNNKVVFFFGCIYTDKGSNKIIHKGTGFYNPKSIIKNTGLSLFHPELCKRLRLSH